jgi:hypothetical protein
VLPSLARSKPFFIVSLTVLVLLAAKQSSIGEDPVKSSSDLKLPEGYRIVSPEDWQRIQDRIAQLDALLKPDKPIDPSTCSISGKIAGDVAHLQARFQVATSRPKMTVFLGCPQGKPAAVMLDGQSASGLNADESGLTVQVAKDGDHEITLDMDVPLDAKEGDLGFELSLPRIIKSHLELDVPGHAKTVRVGNRSYHTAAGDDGTAKLEMRPGVVERLEVYWQVPSGRPSAPPTFAIEDRMLVRIAAGTVQTQAALTVRTLSGQPEQFRLFIPGQADKPLAVDPPQISRVLSIDADPASPGWWMVKLKGVGNEPVHLEISTTQARSGATVSIVPMTVAGAARHRGILLISKTPDLQLRLTPRNDNTVTVTPREVSDDDRKPGRDNALRDPNVGASFSYWHLLNPEKPALPPPSLVQVDIEKIKPAVEAHLAYNCTLMPHPPDALRWRLQCQLDLAFAQGAGSEIVVVQLPTDFKYDERVGIQPILAGQSIEYVADKRQLRITFERVPAKHSLSFEGDYDTIAENIERTTLKLPVPLGTLDRGAEIKAEVPRDFKLVPAHPDDPTWDSILPDIRPDTGKVLQKHSWTARRIPELVEFAWRPYQPDLPARSMVQLLVGDRQMQVVQKLEFRTVQGLVERLLLRVPPSLAERVEVETPDGKKLLLSRDGQRLESHDRADVWRLEFRTEAVRRGLTLKYFIGLGDSISLEGRLTQESSVPLVLPEKINGDTVTSIETVVQVLARPSVGVVPLGEKWQELGGNPGDTDTVGDQNSYDSNAGVAPPACVLRAHGFEVPLKLRIIQTSDHELVAALVEAMLVRVVLSEDGTQTYRAGLRMAAIRAPSLDIAVPGAPSTIGLRIVLRTSGSANVRSVSWTALEREEGASQGSHVVRLILDPEAMLKPSVLEVEYRLPAATGGSSWCRSMYQPPRVVGDLADCPVEWLFTLPSGWVAISQQGAITEETGWGFRNWLLGPQPIRSRAALERWLDASANAQLLREEGEPSLVVHATGPVKVDIVHVPEQFWLLACSLVLVAGTLAIWLLARARRNGFGQRLAIWGILVGAVCAVVVAAIIFPGLGIALIYGVQPGVVVLSFVAVVYWAVHRRYRRQVVFMPGFQRVKADSSLSRSSQQRKRTEAANIELPANGSVAWAHATPAPTSEAPALPPAGGPA